jgi:hypothetical protein
MLVTGLKTHGRIRAAEEARFLAAALPHQRERVQSWHRLQRGVPDIREWLFVLDRSAFELQLSQRAIDPRNLGRSGHCYDGGQFRAQTLYAFGFPIEH